MEILILTVGAIIACTIEFACDLFWQHPTPFFAFVAALAIAAGIGNGGRGQR